MESSIIDSCYVAVKQLDNSKLVIKELHLQIDTLNLHIDKQLIKIDALNKLESINIEKLSIKDQLSDIDKKNIEALANKVVDKDKEIKKYKLITYGVVGLAAISLFF